MFWPPCFWWQESHRSYHCCLVYNMAFIWLILRVSLDIHNLILMCLSVASFLFILFGVCWSCWLYTLMCSSLNLGSFKPLFLQIFFYTIFLWDANCTNVRSLDIVSLVSEALFRKIFFLLIPQMGSFLFKSTDSPSYHPNLLVNPWGKL